jgi:hypothetical protein
MNAFHRNFDSEPGLVRNMNPSFLAFVTACAVLIIGCRPAEKTATANSNAPPEAERKTVEFVRRSPTDLTEHMTQWAREGWLVHSLINVTQANDTVLVRAELSRPQLPKAEPKPEVERKTVEFVRQSPTDLDQHVAQWAREGWLMHSLVTVTQAYVTVVTRAELSRPKSAPAVHP